MRGWSRSAIWTRRAPRSSPQRHSVPAYTDFRRDDGRTHSSEIDVVCVLTESGRHAQHAAELAPYGKHLIVEKPMALTLEDADRMIAACDAAGIKLFIVKQNRYNLPVRKLREALDQGRFGKLVMGTTRVRWCRRQDYYDQDCMARHLGARRRGVRQSGEPPRRSPAMVPRPARLGLCARARGARQDRDRGHRRRHHHLCQWRASASSRRPRRRGRSISKARCRSSAKRGRSRSAALPPTRSIPGDSRSRAPSDEEVVTRYSAKTRPMSMALATSPISSMSSNSVMNGSPSLVDGLEGRKSLELITAIYESMATGDADHDRLRRAAQPAGRKSMRPPCSRRPRTSRRSRFRSSTCMRNTSAIAPSSTRRCSGRRAIRSFIGGAEHEAFGREFAAWCGGGPCRAGRQRHRRARRSPLIELLGPGDGKGEIITTSHTFIATAEAIVNAGYRPVFCRYRCRHLPDSSPEAVERAITPATRAIMPVHLYGQMVDMRGVARDRRPAWPRAHRGRGAGAWRALRRRSARRAWATPPASASIPARISAPGAMPARCSRKNADLIERIARRANHGRSGKYVHDLSRDQFAPRHAAGGDPARQAAPSRLNGTRRAAASPPVRRDCSPAQNAHRAACHRCRARDHVFHLYVVQVDDRDRVRERLNAAGIGAGVHYPVPVHEQPAFRDLGYAPDDLPRQQPGRETRAVAADLSGDHAARKSSASRPR